MSRRKAAAGAVAAAAAVLLFLMGRMYLSVEREPYRVYFIPKVIDENSDFWTQMQEGVMMAAEEAGAELTVVGAAEESDYRTQNALLEQALEQEADAIILVPSDYHETAKSAAKIREAGIVLVIADSALEQDPGECFVATDNIEAGRKQGEWLKGLLRENSQIAVIAHEKTTSTAIDRETGLRLGLGEEEDRIVAVEYSGSSYDNAFFATETLLGRYPEIDFLVGLNEYTTVGAARAVKKMGMEQQVSIVGFDSSIAEIQLLEEGLLTATVIQKPFFMGYTAMEAALMLLEEKQPQPFIDSGSVLITIDNLYQQENQKLLFPFKE